jgi:hypothetical protein
VVVAKVGKTTICSILVDDTDPKIRAMMTELYRRMTPQQKLARVFALTALTHELALVDIRRRHPDESAREHRFRLASRTMDPELLKRATGWADHETGY